MNRLRISVIILLSMLFSTPVFAQDTTHHCCKGRFYSDFVQGTYLFLEAIPYKSFSLFGARLGYETNAGFAIAAEYVLGNQQDNITGENGLTHHASLQAAYFFTPQSSRFRPYAFAGGGFLEFKNFAKDKYGIAYYSGLGLEMQISDKVHTLLEPRYINMANFQFDGVNQFGVLWGVRLSF